MEIEITPAMRQARARLMELRAEGKFGWPASIDSYWDVIDTYTDPDPALPPGPHLALLHYNARFEPTNKAAVLAGRIRGAIVDLRDGLLISDMFGYNYQLGVDAPIQVLDGRVRINAKTEFPIDELMFSHGGDSVMVRVFRWHGTTFFSTHRRISARLSRWGNGELFFKTFARLSGWDETPDAVDVNLEALFRAAKYSPFTYHFLLSDDSVRLNTSVRENRLYMLGVPGYWNPASRPDLIDPSTMTDGHLRPMILNFDQLMGVDFSTPEHPFDRNPIPRVPMQIAKVNQFLFPEQGGVIDPNLLPGEMALNWNGPEVTDVRYNPLYPRTQDPRLRSGDFVIAYRRGPTGLTVFRLESPAYRYRSLICNDDAYPYHRFVSMIPSFIQNYNNMIEGYPKLGLPTKTPDDRVRYWHRLLVNALKPGLRSEAEGYLNRFNQDLELLVTLIQAPPSTGHAQSLQQMRHILDMANRPIGARAKMSLPDRIRALLTTSISENDLYPLLRTAREHAKLTSRPPRSSPPAQ